MEKLQIIQIEEIKNLTSINENIIIQINLSTKNITKTSLNIFYLYKKGFKNFLINYNYKNTPNISQTNSLNYFIKDLIKIIRKTNIKIYFQGYSNNIFQTNILKPSLMFEFKENLIEFKSMEKIDEENNQKNKEEKIKENYIKIFSSQEFKKIKLNKELTQINKDFINKFENKQIKKTGNEILKHFEEQKNYMQTYLVYIDSFPQNLEESSKERFVYFINNSKEKQTIKETQNLIKSHFQNLENLNKILNIIKKSSLIALSFGLMGDNQIRKTLYLTIDLLNLKEIEELNKLLKINIDISKKYWGIGIDLKKNKTSIKTYYKLENQTPSEILSLTNQFNSKNQTTFQNFIKENNKKQYNQILEDFKFKNNQLYGKKIEFSPQFDEIKEENILKTLPITKNYLQNKELYSISFEISNKSEEKLNIYYLLK